MSQPSFADDSDRFLPIWTEDWGTLDMARIKEAKRSLGLDYTVYPRHADKPGEYNRVLAVGSHPPYLCDYALIGPKSDSQGLAAALAWTLGETEDKRATTIADTLSAIMDGPVHEMTQEELDGEAALIAYLTD